MNRFNRNNLQKRKRKITKRLARKNYLDQDRPFFRGANVRYEMAGRAQGMGHGGVGAIFTMLGKLGFSRRVNDSLRLLKLHLPYFESDHVLNIAFNVLVGGTRLEDLEGLRHDEAYMDALGAERIPDPTTAGDFLRRFGAGDICALMETINDIRETVWDNKAKRDPHFYDEAIVEVDGTLAETLGECKGGMDISYKGIWGYAPLLVTLANTREVLYIVNRPGNTPSCKDAARWINLAVARLAKKFKKVTVRGDTDFSLTEHLDAWDEKVGFVFGYDARANLLEQARNLPESAWETLERAPKYTVKTRERTRPFNVKEAIVRAREFQTLRLQCEDVAEFSYQPAKCNKPYRMVVVRKNISVEKGDAVLFDDIRYFFYITNNFRAPKEQIVFEANARCDQENIIAQLKSGINALRAPVDDLTSNWAYMVIASLAWTFKAWYGLLTPDETVGREILRMEYKKFLHNFIAIPCQIIHGARGLVIRVIGYTRRLEPFFETWDAIRRLRPT